MPAMRPAKNGETPHIKALPAVDPSQKPAALPALEPLLTHELDAGRAHAAKVRQMILGPDKA
jgi:hypothetical protein